MSPGEAAVGCPRPAQLDCWELADGSDWVAAGAHDDSLLQAQLTGALGELRRGSAVAAPAAWLSAPSPAAAAAPRASPQGSRHYSALSRADLSHDSRSWRCCHKPNACPTQITRVLKTLEYPYFIGTKVGISHSAVLGR